MTSVKESLTKLSKFEIKHRDFPEQQLDYYTLLPEYTTFDGQPVYKFTFQQVLIQSLARDQAPTTIRLSNPLTSEITLLLSQHARYSIVPSHVHNYIEINYVLHGGVTELIEGKKYRLKTGDMCFLDTNTIHTLLDTNENDIIINILIKKEYFTSYFLNQIPHQGELASFIMQCISNETSEADFLIIRSAKLIKPLILDILDEQRRKETGYLHVMEAFLQVFFIRLTRAQTFMISNQHDLTHDIRAYIQANFRDTTLNKAAAYFSFQPNYFSYLVHKQTGQTFKQLVQAKQMEMATSYLINTDWPITRIIDELGFTNNTFFYKKFQQTFAETPKEYREQHTKQD